MKITEILALGLMLALLVVPWFIAGLNIWGWLFVCIAALVLGFEAYSTIKNGKTISQIFWAFRKERPKSAYALLGLVSLGWIILVIHLLG